MAEILDFDGLNANGAVQALRAAPDSLIIAGWTGRDVHALEAHIRELEALGVRRPASTPIFYRVAASLLTHASCIEVVGARTSGEAEVVLLNIGGELWLGLGSDHTDREAETMGVTLSKQLCAKPIARSVWRYSDVEAHWDRLVLRSHRINGGVRTLYQEGPVAALRPPSELAARYRHAGHILAADWAMFCGTLAVRGDICPADVFEIELDDPLLGRKLGHRYEIRTLPVAG